jgi:hypothetical protein
MPPLDHVARGRATGGGMRARARPLTLSTPPGMPSLHRVTRGGAAYGWIGHGVVETHLAQLLLEFCGGEGVRLTGDHIM